MKTTWLIWIPRGLIMLFALFTVLFSLDVFEGTSSIGEKIQGFMIHNIIFFVLSFILVATWKGPLIAGILCIIAGIALTVIFHSRWDLRAYLIMGGSPMIMGILFVVVHLLNSRKVIRE